MTKSFFAYLMVGVALLVVSCGGVSGQTDGGGRGGNGAAGGGSGQTGGTGGGGASCASVSPCGGNIVGTWKVTQSCVTATEDITSAGAGCTGASAVFDITYGGSLTYHADLTFDYSAVTASDVVHEHFPNGCSPFGLTCEQLAQTATDAGRIGCSTDTQGGCNCDDVMMLTSTNPTGTYAVSGSKLATSNPNGQPSTSSYCVQGNLLYLILDQTADAGLSATGAIVLAKQ
jgi:hypothetical protein